MCFFVILRITDIEEIAARDFAQRTEEILNWNPITSFRFNDKMLGMTCFVKPHRRGVGGLIRYQWHDFRVVERRLNDASLTELTDIDSLPTGPPQRYLLAVLYKVGRDTFELISKIAWHLGIHRDRIGFAGLKDRAAVTMQEVSVDCITPGGVRGEQVLSLNKVLLRAGIGNLRWSPRALHFGEHAGNHFSLVIRQVEVEERIIHKSMRALKRRGFINYFGHQRFGIGSSSSGLSAVDVGKALVKGHYRQAAQEIMNAEGSCSEEEASAKQAWLNMGGTVAAAREALSKMPKHCVDERVFLQSLLSLRPHPHTTTPPAAASNATYLAVPAGSPPPATRNEKENEEENEKENATSPSAEAAARQAMRREMKKRKKNEKRKEAFTNDDFRRACEARNKIVA